MIAALFAVVLHVGAAEPAVPAVPAVPAETEPSAVVSDDDAARALYASAKQLYDSGQFEAARTEFQAAFAKKALPGFLFNIGQCERQLGNHERAVFFFERYLDEKPDASNRPLVEELLRESRLRLAETAIAPVVEVSKPPTPPAVATTVAPAASPTTQPADAETEAADAWLPWVIVGGATAVVAVVGTGAVVWWAGQPSLGVHDGRSP